MNEANFSKGGGSDVHMMWNGTQNDELIMMQDEPHPTQAQQQQPYPVQQQQQQQVTPTTYNQQQQSNNNNNHSNDNGDGHHSSLTPFRPMQPREFTLGSNLKRVHPAMPMLTLPADVSGMRKSAQSAKKRGGKKSGGAGAGGVPSRAAGSQQKLGDILGAVSSSSSSGNDILQLSRRSSLYSSRRSSVRSEMGRISEESGSKSSSGMSSAFSETLTRNVDEAGEIVGDGNAVVDEGSQTCEEIIEELLADDSGTDDEDVTAGGAVHTRTRETANTSQDINSGYDMNNSRDSNAAGEDQEASVGDEDDDSCGSFLSWDQSRRSADYIIHQAMEEWDEKKQPSPSGQLQQQQRLSSNYNMQPQNQQQQLSNNYNMHPSHQQQQQFFEQTNSHESYPTQHQQQPQTHSTKYQTAQTQTPNDQQQPYNRKVSNESHDTTSLHDHSPTPFRPMLPRELLLGSNLRRGLNHHSAMPFPVLPADVSLGTAKSIAAQQQQRLANNDSGR